eukprot:TRINITY_DN35748_c0_g1_i1.p1 TRINITY_DN35748_c0_g1~~TRINITY_DN35748_c0_g1_i1.p1  ORF type:complete len:171 (+),score=13.83 TRINITY_DN35748_c0_g1_i1:80-592(+)
MATIVLRALLSCYCCALAHSSMPLHLAVSFPRTKLTFARPGVTARLAAGDSGGEPKFYETKKVNWSDDDYIILPLIDESQANSTIGAAVVAFMIGLFLPIFGGFWTGVIFGLLGSKAKTGELGSYQRQSELGRKIASFSDEAGSLLGQGGMSLVKAYNWCATKLASVRIK